MQYLSIIYRSLLSIHCWSCTHLPCITQTCFLNIMKLPNLNFNSQHFWRVLSMKKITVLQGWKIQTLWCLIIFYRREILALNCFMYLPEPDILWRTHSLKQGGFCSSLQFQAHTLYHNESKAISSLTVKGSKKHLLKD